MAPDADENSAAAYLAAAESIARGGNAVLPAGATFTPTTMPLGLVQLFKERKRDLQERLVIAGTGGLLTTLAAPAGLGSGAADTQADCFDLLAAADATAISERFQRLVDRAVLGRLFPGQPRLAYFQIAAAASDDTSDYVERVTKLASTGYITAPKEVSEKLGAEITREGGDAAVLDNAAPPLSPAPLPNTNPNLPQDEASAGSGESTQRPHPPAPSPTGRGGDGDAVAALAALTSETRDALAAAEAEDWAPITAALAALDETASPEDYAAALRRLRDNLPSIIEEVYSSGKTAAALGKALTDAAALGTASITELKNSACRAKDPANCKIHGTGKYAPPPDAGASGAESGTGVPPVNPEGDAAKVSKSKSGFEIAETSDPKQLGEFFDRATSNPQYKGVRILDPVEAGQAKAINDAYGVAVEGMKYAVTSDNIRHSIKHHGDSKTEVPRGQIAITKQDFEALPRILPAGVPVKGQKLELSSHGTKQFLLESKIEGAQGRYHYAVEVIESRGRRCIPPSPTRSAAKSASASLARPTANPGGFTKSWMRTCSTPSLGGRAAGACIA